MIDLYYWTTPNGHKITMFLEETGIEHRILPINIGKGEQFAADFLRIAPNNRIPAIVDQAPADGGAPISLFESGAILLYLADKTGRFIPADLRGRTETIQWLFWQMGGLGPMAGQNHHFTQYAPEKVPYAIERYTKETARLYAVLNKRLADREYLSPASTRSPTWPATPGSCRTAGRGRTSTISRISSAGSLPSASGRRQSAPMPWSKKSIPRR
jgi:GST-like protein